MASCSPLLSSQSTSRNLCKGVQLVWGGPSSHFPFPPPTCPPTAAAAGAQDVWPAGRCGLCSSRTPSRMPTPDKGASKCLLSPSPALVQSTSLFHRDSHRDERMCLSDGATEPPDHSRGCFDSQSLGSSLPCNCACPFPTWTHPQPPPS